MKATDFVFGMLIGVTGCSGQVENIDDADAAETTGGNNQGDDEASGGGNSASSGGSSSGGRHLSDHEPLPLESALGLYGVNVSGGDTAHELPDKDADGIRALSTDADSPRISIGTHTHRIDLVEEYERVEFSARASHASEVAVSMSSNDALSQWHAQEEGRTLQGVTVVVTEEWQDYSIPFEDMEPLGAGEPYELSDDNGSAFHVFFEDEAGVTVWFSDFILVPASPTK